MESNKKQLYSIGILFSPDLNSILMVEKNKPDWQVGYLNAIGGKIESGETPEAAMYREFLEESGLNIKNWEYKAVYGNSNYTLYIFSAIGSFEGYTPINDAGERVMPIDLEDILLKKKKIIPNLNWIIPMCMDSRLHHATLTAKEN